MEGRPHLDSWEPQSKKKQGCVHKHVSGKRAYTLTIMKNMVKVCKVYLKKSAPLD